MRIGETGIMIEPLTLTITVVAVVEVSEPEAGVVVVCPAVATDTGPIIWDMVVIILR